MIGMASTIQDNAHSLEEKVEFLRHRGSYPGATHVEVMETHMSWVFLTDQVVYKLKKPVRYEFLDFKTLDARYKYCVEELHVNKPLAGDTYLGIVPLRAEDGLLNLDGKGLIVDWLVKMKRLPEKDMLHIAIKEGAVQNEWVQQAAEMLADFYIGSPSVRADPASFRQRLINDVQQNSDELLSNKFHLSHSLIIGIATDLLHFVIKQANLFDQRVSEGRIIDGHGDLRPEHICLAPKPVIIDRVEFCKDLRIMDVAEELSSLSVECDILDSPDTGQLFLNCYYWKSRDRIPDMLIAFYKAKRALLRAKLSIHHLLEKQYHCDKQKWYGRCETYLHAAGEYCDLLPKNAKGH